MESSIADFVFTLNHCIEQLYELAASVRPTEPGTAEVIAGFAESQAGSALDLIRRWPS